MSLDPNAGRGYGDACDAVTFVTEGRGLRPRSVMLPSLFGLEACDPWHRIEISIPAVNFGQTLLLDIGCVIGVG